MSMSVFPHQVRFSCVKIYAVNTEVLFPQRPDHLLDTDAGIIQFQTFPENIMYIFHIEKGRLVSVKGIGICHNFHQVPAVTLPGVSAVTAA